MVYLPNNKALGEFSVGELWEIVAGWKSAGHKKSHDVDKEVVANKTEVSELWNKLAISTVEEILGYLDLRLLTRFSRVSKPWKESMARYGVINSGVVFLVSPSYYGRSSRLLASELLGESVWSRLFQLRPNTIKHFVFVGQPMPFDEGRPFGKLFRLPILCAMSPSTPLLSTVEMIRLNVTPTFRWWFNFRVPAMKLTNASLESGEKTQLVHTLDNMGLVWPYKKKQLEWLKESLDNMRSVRWTTIRRPDEEYRQARARTYGKNNQFRKLGVSSTALNDGRELDTLDAAFLMRLLWWLKEGDNVEAEEISRPPYEVPQDFQM